MMNALNLLLAFVCTVVPAAYTLQNVLNCSSEDEKHPLRFLAFFPCPALLSDVEQCDLRTQTAAELAVEDINMDETLLSCFELKLIPRFDTDISQDSIDRYRFINKRYLDQNLFHGIIGPYNSSIATDLSYVLGRLFTIPQISYSLTDPLLDNSTRYPHLYSTVPTDLFLNQVRKEILKHFDWNCSVAILSSNAQNHVTIAQDLRQILNDSNITVQYFGSYDQSSERLLQLAKSNDTRVFLPIIAETEARQLFCEAYNAGLTTADHVWILPAIYNPQWWYLDTESEALSDCTNDIIRTAINSTFFVDTLAFNPNIQNDAETIYQRVFRKLNDSIRLNESYPSTVLHSKLLNAYDAVNVLALTWNTTLNELVNNDTLNYSRSTDDILAIINNPYSETLGSLLNSSLREITSPYNGFTIFNGLFNRSQYGSGLVTQISGDRETIVATYTNTSDQETAHFNICTEAIKCGVTWKGGYQPAHECNRSIIERKNVSEVIFYIASFVVYSLVIIGGLIFSVVTCACRKNKYFKATTPFFTVLLNLSSSVIGVSGLILVVNTYLVLLGKVQGDSNAICSIIYIGFEVAFLIIMATVLVKNWRIYRIFHNPRNKTRRHLSTWVLSLDILLIIFPVLVVIIIVLIVDYHSHVNEDCYELIDPCSCLYTFDHKWHIVVYSYNMLLLLALLLIGCVNSSIQSFFQIEGQLATVASFVTGLAQMISPAQIFENPDRHSFFQGIVFPNVTLMFASVTLLVFINLPKIRLIKKERRKNYLIIRSAISEDYIKKCEEIADLKAQIRKLDTLLLTAETEV